MHELYVERQLSIEQIAQAVGGCTPKSVVGALTTHRLYTPTRVFALSHVSADDLRALARQTRGWRSLAAKLGHTREAVKHRALQTGVIDELQALFVNSSGPELNELIAAHAVADRYTTRDIAAFLGVSAETVIRRLRALGIPYSSRGLPPCTIREVADAYWRGEDVHVVSDLHGVTVDQVYWAAKKAADRALPLTGDTPLADSGIDWAVSRALTARGTSMVRDLTRMQDEDVTDLRAIGAGRATGIIQARDMLRRALRRRGDPEGDDRPPTRPVKVTRRRLSKPAEAALTLRPKPAKKDTPAPQQNPRKRPSAPKPAAAPKPAGKKPAPQPADVSPRPPVQTWKHRPTPAEESQLNVDVEAAAAFHRQALTLDLHVSPESYVRRQFREAGRNVSRAYVTRLVQKAYQRDII